MAPIDYVKEDLMAGFIVREVGGGERPKRIGGATDGRGDCAKESG